MTPASASAAPTWLEPEPLSAPGADAYNPDVAVDRDGDTLAVWQRTDGVTGRIQASFRPAGGEFSAPGPISQVLGGASGATAAFDGGGDALVSFQRYDGNNLRAQVNIRPDGGTFSTPQTLSPAGWSAESTRVTTYGTHGAVVVWRIGNGNVAQARIQVSYRQLDGSFGPALDVSPAGDAPAYPRAAVGPDGRGVVVWESAVGGKNRVKAAPIAPSGAGAVQTLSDTSKSISDPRIAVDGDGNATAVWSRLDAGGSRLMSAYRPAGGTFGSEVPVSSTGTVRDAKLISGPGGRSLLGWHQIENNVARVYYATSGGPGVAFGTPQPQTPAGVNSTSPDFAINANGDVLFSWRRQVGLYYRTETATGTIDGNFGTPQLASPDGVSVDSAMIGIDAEGNGAAVWRRNPAKGDKQVHVAGFDAAPPRIDGLQFPTNGDAGAPLSFSAQPFDVWSPVTTTWTFGDGTTATGSSADHAYTTGGPFNASVTATDAVGNSTTVDRGVTIASPPAAPGDPGNPTTPAGPGDSDTIAPTLALTGKAPKLSKLIRGGLPLTVTCSEACSVTTQLRIDGATARRYGLSKSKKAVVIGRATVRTTAGRATKVTLKLGKKAKRRLSRARSLKLTALASATDAAGNRSRNVSRNVSVKG